MLTPVSLPTMVINILSFRPFQQYVIFDHPLPSKVLYGIFLILCMASFGSSTRTLLAHRDVVNVMDYGAVGNAQTDDSQAFMKAWETVCAATSNHLTLKVPKRRTFLLKPVMFQGPCKSNNVDVQISGDIIAPGELSEWKNNDLNQWLGFSQVKGLTVHGDGSIDGKGINWWKSCANNKKCSRPTSLSFHGCENLKVRGLRHKNSQRNHISISDCVNVIISDLHISAPETSPNTDGIDIARSTNIQIYNCQIGTGDDCIAINDGSSGINITWVTCGPGHGISIGSLGKGGEDDSVEEIHVKHCNFNATMNGVRIKTWRGGSGYARKISFENITMIDAKNPIIIDQFYCPHQSCSNKSTSAVKVSDVTYTGVYGTSMKEEAINLSCDEDVGCTNIVLDHVNITSSSSKVKTYASCLNAHGSSNDTFPQVPCLLA